MSAVTETVNETAKILASREEPASVVDPFRARPCTCATVTVHTTDGEYLGDDLVECGACGWRLTLRELYRDHMPPGGIPGVAPPD